MGIVRETSVLIGFYGDDLDPAEITQSLGAEPTIGVRKGEAWFPQPGAAKIAPTGSWRIKAERCTPGDLDGPIHVILDRLSNDLSLWNDFARRYDARVFCGLFLGEFNEGIALRAETLFRLGERGLLIDFDIYAPPEEASSSPSDSAALQPPAI
ncbi:DUF4279 domain-containing protein [uncultured Sphingomonas sp.]|uniref:DUF4279 domain-containing protein n=1 Tax=uncultured Sphingomonas sp. TaxID=158754 RepID=UPI0025D6A41E|nr:DUF4279 domain-containing protein [uncultured Sphingomonas sp.]